MRELSADVRAAIVLDATGAPLAGPAALADPARALLAAGAGAVEVEAAGGEGVVCAVRSPAHAAVAVCGRFAIAGVVRQDLRAALAAIEGRPQPPPDTVAAAADDALEGAADALKSAAEALISAVQRGFSR